MVSIIHGGDNSYRINLILEAAQKRFAMYGLGKTTMKEIADDLNLSKGSLYYYYPDKENLYRAVVIKEHDEFLQALSEKMSQTDSAEIMIRDYSEIRLVYFKTMINLSRFKIEEYRSFKPFMASVWAGFQESEVELLATIIQKGIDKRKFHIENATETAKLFLDLLLGMRHSFIKNKELFYIEEADYEALKLKTEQFIEIFINGLKYKKQ